jgi:peptide/nickel transport system ATP-binding protein
VQAIFQDPFEVYNPFYHVDHMLVTPIKKFHLASSRRQMTQMIQDALRTVGLKPEETLGRYPHQLSGGQRQRVTVARALLIRPKLVVADEPVSMIDASLRATVLESLRRLFNDFDISFVYITHDLTTAYQVAENVLVMYRGRIAEAGDVEHVIKHPEHPYTQLLVSSIPVANPDQRWGEDIPVVETGGPAADREHACAFAPRCPHVHDRCTKEVPPLYRTLPHRATSCFLHERPEAVSGDITQVFNEAEDSAVRTSSATPSMSAS